MPYKFVYFDEAFLDVKEAKEWYKNQEHGLEKRFSEFVKSALIKIKRNPEINTIRYKNVRFQHVEKIPYIIHYYINEEINSIIITAIVHKARHPDVAKNRL